MNLCYIGAAVARTVSVAVTGPLMQPSTVENQHTSQPGLRVSSHPCEGRPRWPSTAYPANLSSARRGTDVEVHLQLTHFESHCTSRLLTFIHTRVLLYIRVPFRSTEAERLFAGGSVGNSFGKERQQRSQRRTLRGSAWKLLELRTKLHKA